VALSTSEAAQDAAEAKLEAVLRGLDRGQPGSSGVKAETRYTDHRVHLCLGVDALGVRRRGYVGRGVDRLPQAQHWTSSIAEL
jgi:hypothetical protein